MSLKLVQERDLMIPRSEADNAYDLSLDVADAIRQEHRRYNQGEWLLTDPNEICHALRGLENPIAPSCQTMGCRAGWYVVLSEGREGAFGYRIGNRAREILGYDPNSNSHEEYRFYVDISQLFSGDAVDQFSNDEDEDGYRKPRIGTPEYAEEGARGIEQFAEKWKNRLLATPVVRKTMAEVPTVSDSLPTAE
jgi:hypothetical protein